MTDKVKLVVHHCFSGFRKTSVFITGEHEPDLDIDDPAMLERLTILHQSRFIYELLKRNLITTYQTTKENPIYGIIVDNSHPEDKMLKLTCFSSYGNWVLGRWVLP